MTQPTLRQVGKQTRDGHTVQILRDEEWEEFRVRLDYLPKTDYHTSCEIDAADTADYMLKQAAQEDQDNG